MIINLLKKVSLNQPSDNSEKNENDYISREVINDETDGTRIINNRPKIHLKNDDSNPNDNVTEINGKLIKVKESLVSEKRDDKSLYSFKDNYTAKDVILYALEIGATVKDPYDFAYLYEKHKSFAVLPTFYTIFGPIECMTTDLIQKALPHKKMIDKAGLLHGEQYLKVLKEIPVEAKVETRFEIQDVLDKEKSAVILLGHEIFDLSSQEKLEVGQMIVMIKGAGNFDGPRYSEYEIPLIDPPKRSPDAFCIQQTCIDQAAIYRLGSGDVNRLHIDPNIAAMVRFDQPILHGLCSLGFASRHVLNTFASGNPDLFDDIKARFVKPVFPGQTLRTEMWREGKRIHLQTIVVENNSPIIAGAYIDLKEVQFHLNAKH